MENWGIDNGKLFKILKFSDFKAAVLFINQLAAEAESLNHHPDVCLFDYCFLRIDLFTHQKKAITQLDHQLAEKIDRLYHLFINNISD